MRVAFLDLVAESAPPDPATSSAPVFGAPPRRVASPSLLARAADGRVRGDEVSYGIGTAAELIAADAWLGSDRVLVGGAARRRAAAAQLCTELAAKGAACELAEPDERDAGLPDYGLAAARGAVLADAEVEPIPAPLHPWVAPARGGDPAARLAAALAAAPADSETHIYLCDDRVVTDMPRLRMLAEAVRELLRAKKTLLQIHLRAWPEDLLGDRVMDHLSLLPLASLDLLVGSLGGPAPVGARGGLATEAAAEQFLAATLRCGLAHLGCLSVVLGLPGEPAEVCADTVHRTFQLVTQHRISRIRFSFYLGPEGPPPNEALEDRFLATHPDWQPFELQGIQDLIAVVAMACPQIHVTGPMP